ncbi:hypothetical protein SAMN04490184_5913 [Pseudomonas extremorientalis]|uniref:AraC family transcriptional regulator n=1 Tax=Pseudomonas extremorientalis TaxID=169669 RepID=A0ABY0TA23_9PSED|nr:hypothetical protein SAMN04490184_5913 [Pseudomonas extremorientalis]
MKTVAMVLFPDFLLLDMAGPLEVFSIANRYLPASAHYRSSPSAPSPVHCAPPMA